MNLDELLREAIAHPEKRSLFLQTLIKSDVYVICKNPVKPNPDGSVRMTKTTKVTGKGQQYFLNKYLKKEEAV